MRRLLLLTLLVTACAHSSTSSHPPGPVQNNKFPVAAYDRGCTSWGQGVYIAPHQFITASHVVAALDSNGRTNCEIAEGFLGTDGSHSIVATAVSVEEMPASILSYSQDDSFPAVLLTESEGVEVYSTAQMVGGTAILITPEGPFDVTVTSAISSWSGRANYIGPPCQHGWSGSPIIQNGKVVGVAVSAEFDGGDIAEIK